MVRCLPGTILAPLSLFARTEYKMSFTSVDFPEPLTPVTATKTDSGKVTSISCKLFSLADLIVTDFFTSIGRLFLGNSITDLPDRYAPVIESLFAIRS